MNRFRSKLVRIAKARSAKKLTRKERTRNDSFQEDAHDMSRVGSLSQIARTTWFGLLAYLAFVGITILGVENADLFVPTRQTQLPLVNVSVPTVSFFWFASILGSALFIYFHLQLMKLWEALSVLPPIIGNNHLSEAIYPWLISDLALARRGDGALKRRPLRLISRVTNWCLVWAGAPVVLAGFWWRSMSKHDEWMTLGIAATLLIAVYVGLTSHWQATNLMRDKDGRPPWRGWFRRPFFALFCAFVVLLSWARTEGGIDHRFNQMVTLWNFAMKTSPNLVIFRACPDHNPAYCYYPNGDPKIEAELQLEIVRNLPFVWTLDDLEAFYRNSYIGNAISSFSDWRLFPVTDLAGVSFVPNPENLLDHTTERRRFRKTWCERQGIDLEVCGRLYTASQPQPEHLAHRRKHWCSDERRRISAEECMPWFEKVDAEFEREWRQLWRSRTSSLVSLSLKGVDLRRANLQGAFLIGVDLRDARLGQADLSEARLEGTNLSNASLDSANLNGASLDAAVLSSAFLNGANLSGARLENVTAVSANFVGANLTDAQMIQSNLERARMDVAILNGADLEGSNLDGAHLNRSELIGSTLVGASLRGTDFTRAALMRSNFKDAFLSIGSFKAFEDANLREADFRVSYVKQDTLDSAFGSTLTKIPSNVSIPSHWAKGSWDKFAGAMGVDYGYEAFLGEPVNWSIRDEEE